MADEENAQLIDSPLGWASNRANCTASLEVTIRVPAANPLETMKQHIAFSLLESAAALDALQRDASALDAIQAAANVLIETFSGDGRVFSCGNGGSMSDAMHFAEELTGRYRRNRRPLPATAISDPGHLTCVANDFGYEEVFSRYLEAHGRAGDCVVALSTSGTSKNIIRAAEVAKSLKMGLIVLSGRQNQELSNLSTVYICTPGGRFADRVQELHIKVLHILIELVERHYFPENYSDA